MNEGLMEKQIDAKESISMPAKIKRENARSIEMDGLSKSCLVAERSKNPLIRISSLAYLIVRRPDIEKAAQFFVNFGLVIDERSKGKIYLRGRSCESHIIILEKGTAEITGVGFTASESDLKKLSQAKDSQITKRNDGPMGGSYVSLNDPDGLSIEVNHGIRPLSALDSGNHLRDSVWNAPESSERVNETVRNDIEPRLVEKLGHTLWSIKNMAESLSWYQDTLGLITSDFQFLKGDDLPVVAFMRCDRGDQATDHHTIGLGIAPELGHNHSAFEMSTFEDIAIANQWLKKKSYKHGWGIGRHILGSQVFDYWRDPQGEMFEHYADGDLFTNEINAGYHFFNKHAQHQWGPDMTEEFKGTTRPLKLIKSVITRLMTNDDLKLSRLRSMLKYS